MHVLIFNWRDIRNPKAGGAEILTHEISKQLIKHGHSVTQFSSMFEYCKKKETVDGVKIIRDGHPDLRTLFSSVHFKAFDYYRRGLFGNIDVVIDEVHGVPFFTPLYIREKKVALICEYAGSLWDKAVAPPFNILGKIVERIYPYFYRKVTLTTISDSSRKELSEKLFRKRNVFVIHPGCATPIAKTVTKKPRNLTITFIARLAKSKGLEEAIKTAYELKKTHKDVMLHVVGRGEKSYVESIKKFIHEKDMDKNIVLHGYISEKEKISIIDQSHFHIITSEKEGWGLTVHEANARGVPVVSYNVEGVRDVIKNNINGFLVRKNTPKSLALQILTAHNDKKLYNRMVERSILERRKYTWENTEKEFKKLLA